MMIIIREIAP